MDRLRYSRTAKLNKEGKLKVLLHEGGFSPEFLIHEKVEEEDGVIYRFSEGNVQLYVQGVRTPINWSFRILPVECVFEE